MSKSKLNQFTHKDGRVAKQLALSKLDEGDESKAMSRLITNGWSARTTDLHKSEDGKFLHIGLKEECPIHTCVRSRVVVEPSNLKNSESFKSSVVKEVSNIKEDKDSSAKIEPLEDLRSRPRSTEPMKESEKDNNKIEVVKDNEALKLNLITKIENTTHNLHTTLFFGPNSHIPLDTSTPEFKCKVKSFKVMKGPHSSLAFEFEPSKKLLKFRDELTKLGFVHNNDSWLPHVSLKYDANPDSIDRTLFKLPKTVTFKGISRRIVK